MLARDTAGVPNGSCYYENICKLPAQWNIPFQWSLFFVLRAAGLVICMLLLERFRGKHVEFESRLRLHKK